jgi:hypothetical protein
MSAGVVNRLADACITSAARRWPEGLSTTMAYEWRAELAALRADRTLHPVIRAWRGLRFALSLAVSPSVESEKSMTVTWRDRLPGLGGAATAAAGVLGTALFAVVAYRMAAFGLESNLDQHASENVVESVGTVLLVVAALAFGWIGTIAARRSPITSSKPSIATIAILSSVPLGLAMWLVLGAPADEYRPTNWSDMGLACVAWIAVTALTAVPALRLAVIGRRAAAWSVGIVGGLIAVDVASITGGLRTASQLHAGYGFAAGWFPLSLLPSDIASFGHYYATGTANYDGTSVSGGPFYASSMLLGGIGAFAGPLLLCSAFVLAFTMRAVRGPVKPTVPVAATDTPARTGLIVRAVAAGGVVVGLGSWAYLTWLGAARPQPVDFSSIPQDMLWFRLLAIVVTVIAAVILLVSRGPVALPALATFVVMFATDSGIDRASWQGAGAASLVVLIGVATLYGAWWLSDRLAGAGTTEASARRTLTGVAVMAALLVPTFGYLSQSTSRVIVVLSYVFAAALWILSITAACASRRVPFGRLTMIAYVLLPLAVVMVMEGGPVSRAVFSGLYYPFAVFFIQAPLAVTALAAARWRGPIWRLRQVMGWVMFGVIAAVVTNPIADALNANGSIIAGPIARIDPVRGPFVAMSTSPYFAGQLVLGLALGILAARRARPTSAPTADAAARPEPDAGPAGLTVAVA